MKILDIDQNTGDWLKWRQQGLGGSDAGHVMGGFPWTSQETLLDQKRGVVDGPVENDRMKRGKDLEPQARLLYQQLTGLRCRPVCVVHDQYPWLRASLDGLSEDGKTVLEIKCPMNKRKHIDALNGSYPDYYRAQLFHNLLVTGADILHFVSYFPDLEPHQQIALVPVEPEEDYMAELLEREQNLWEKYQKEAA